MNSLAHKRCLNHIDREAVARCPQCEHFFCRECVTEHDDKLVCAGCLNGKSKKNIVKTLFAKNVIFLTCYSVAAFFFSWYFFYCIGRLLVRIPSVFSNLIS